MHLLELARRRGSEGIQGAFGYPGIAECHFEGIAAAVDELDPERKAPLVDHTPRAIECDVIGVAAHRGEPFREFFRRRRHFETGRVEEALEQFGTAGELVGKRRRMSQDLGEKMRERRPGFEQSEEIHPG